MPLTLRLLLLLVAFGHFSSASAQSPADTVFLRFDWPVGTTAVVDREFSRINSSPDGSDSLIVRSSYRMHVLPHPEGRLIRTEDYSRPDILTSNADATNFVGDLLRQSASVTPGLVVSPAGEFLRVDDIARLKTAVDSLLQPMFRQMGDASPEGIEFLRSMLSEETLTASVSQEWNLMVWQWADTDFELGAVYGLESEEPSPYLPNFMIPMSYEFSAVERVPCDESSAEFGCIELYMYSTVDAEALRAAAGELLQRLNPGQGAEAIAALTNMNVEHELTLITEPHTLRPHWMELVKYVQVEGAVDSTESGDAATRLDRRTYQYSYQN